MLPAAIANTIFQLTLPRFACMTTPVLFAMPAYIKSVPTAMCGGNPKSNNKGVISEPPPTPVMPTAKPTAAPATIYQIKSIHKPY